MSEHIRLIDPNSIQAAEDYRANGQLHQALAITSAVLGRDIDKFLDGKEVREFASVGGTSLVDLIRLSRIDVDVLKSLANQSKSPRNSYEFISLALGTVKRVYLNSAVDKALNSPNSLYRQPDLLWPETRRDMSKLWQAASLLYPSSQKWRIFKNLDLVGDVLDLSFALIDPKVTMFHALGSASTLLEDSWKLLAQADQATPITHSIKPLIGIERELVYVKNGGIVDSRFMEYQYDRLREVYFETNPNRVVSVGTTIIATFISNYPNMELTRRTKAMIRGDREIILRDHPEWADLRQEVRKLRFQEVKKQLFPNATRIVVPHDRLKSLYNELTSIADCQFKIPH